MAEAWKHTALITIFILSGCVIRTINIRTTPSGADTWLDGRYLGRTPLTVKFNHYGTRLLILRKSGHKSKVLYLKIRPPWYEIFPLDIFCDLLLPFTIEDRRNVDIELIPQKSEPPEGLLRHAGEEE